MRILIADDHDLVRDTIAAFLASEDGVESETAINLDEAVTKIETEGPFDLVLLDYNMPGMNGLEGLERALALNGAKTVAILSGTAPGSVARSAISAGAIGFLPKTMGAKSLVNAVRFMAAGETFVPLSLMEEKDNPASEASKARNLSEREIQVLDGLCRGLANKEIARELDLQEVTIKLHVKTLCRKLEARNRTHAAMIAKEQGLV